MLLKKWRVDGTRGIFAFVFQFAVKISRWKSTELWFAYCFTCRCGTWSVALRGEHELRVIENRVLREILGSKVKEVLRDWKRLDNEEIHDLYSLSVIWVSKWRRMRWAGLVARMWEQRSALSFLVFNLLEKDHLGDLGVSGRIVWKWGLKWIRRTWT